MSHRYIGISSFHLIILLGFMLCTDGQSCSKTPPPQEEAVKAPEMVMKIERHTQRQNILPVGNTLGLAVERFSKGDKTPYAILKTKTKRFDLAHVSLNASEEIESTRAIKKSPPLPAETKRTHIKKQCRKK